MSIIVRAANLRKVYSDGDIRVEAVKNISLDIKKSEFVAIMGPSGSGKSTFLHLLGGLDVPSEGTVFVDGIDLGKLTDQKLTKLRRSKIGFVFQFFTLLPSFTVYENIALPLILEKKYNVERICEVLKFFKLYNQKNHKPSQLSGGQQQRVALARALVSNPAIILADEPTGNLDTKSSDEIMTAFKKACFRLGQTVLTVTHDPKVAIYANRIIVLKDGQIIDELKGDPGFELETVLNCLKKHNL